MKVILLKYRFHFFVSLLVVGLTVLFTWPVILNPFRIIFGYAGDNFGNIWFFWWQDYARKQGLDVAFTPFYEAPVGQRLNLALSESAWMIPFGWVSRFLGAIFTFNFFVFLSFFLSFWTMFGLVFYLTRRRGISLWAGLVFSFSAYHFWQSLSHASLSYIQWLPLFVWSFFYFDRQKNLKSSIFLSLAFVWVALTSFYYAFFSSLVALAFFVLRFIFNFRQYLRFRTIGVLIFSVLIVGIFLAPAVKSFLAVRSDDSSSIPPNQAVAKALERQLDELVGLSARPWDYLIYPPNHPVFGRFNESIYKFIQSLGSDFKVRSAYLPERVVFLGLINFLLFFGGLTTLLYSNVVKRRSGVLGGWGGGLIFLFLVAGLISLPPYFTIKGLTFYTPSYFLYQILPVFRVYTRMGVYVLLFTTLISSIFLSYVFDRLRRVLPSALLLTSYFLLLAFSLFEFWPRPAFTDLRTLPPVYQWLAQEPGDPVVAEYPTAFDLQSGLIFQTFHGKRLFNTTSSSPRYEIWKSVESLEERSTFQTLKAEGVKYVIYHLVDLTPNPYDDWRFFRAGELPTDPEALKISSAGFRLVKQFPEALVYEIN